MSCNMSHAKEIERDIPGLNKTQVLSTSYSCCLDIVTGACNIEAKV